MIDNERIQAKLQPLFAKHGITDQEVIEKLTSQQKNFESYMKEHEKTTHTTLFAEFGIADLPAFSGEYPIAAIRETYRRVSQEVSHDVKHFTELVVVLKLRCVTWHQKGYDLLANLYLKLFDDAATKALQTFKEADLKYYHETLKYI